MSRQSDLIAEITRGDDPLGLAASLHAVNAALSKHWTTTYLHWFTDHGVSHAHRVAEYALALAAVPVKPPFSQLERYVICAAALLHDIGMNDLSLVAHPLGEMTAEDFEAVRHNHAAHTGDILLNGPGDWGLPSSHPVLAEIVALVAKAHGTNHYRQTVEELAGRTSVHNETIRSQAAAAVVLMADEMDLHYERETTLPGNTVLNAVSEAHAFKHRCVVGFTLHAGEDATVVTSLRLSVPDSIQIDDRTQIESWITAKLRRQMSLVESELALGFTVPIKFDRAIRVTHQTALVARSPATKAALAVIRADVSRSQMIDHSTAFSIGYNALVDRHLVTVVGSIDEVGADIHGREDIYEALLKDSIARGIRVIRCDRLRLGSLDASDVLEEWASQLGADAINPDFTSETDKRLALLRHCEHGLSEISAGPILLCASSIDRLTKRSRSWLARTALPRLYRSVPYGLPALITTSPDAGMSVPGQATTSIPAQLLDSEEVRTHLAAVGLGDGKSLGGALLTYSSFKEICRSHEQWLLEQCG